MNNLSAAVILYLIQISSSPINLRLSYLSILTKSITRFAIEIVYVDGNNIELRLFLYHYSCLNQIFAVYLYLYDV